VTASVLVVGAGGIAAPFGWAIARSGAPLSLLVADDDVVDVTNLHRQVLFGHADVGRPKLEAFRERLEALSSALSVRTLSTRVLPDNAVELASQVDLVVDASDNFATRFLVADVCALAGRPCVHAAAVRWQSTVLAVGAGGRPCYRCLFEDLPAGPAPDCATAGVVGPVCGVAGAIAADLTLRCLRGDASATGAVFTYDGFRDRLRRVAVKPRATCPLCGQLPAIRSIDASRYDAEMCTP
jgi:adenylyltransferase/sulfurtransferase